jgi:CBS domain containing-hemolysin-like protein
MMRLILIWSCFAACLAVSFLLSGMEAGVFALSRLRIRQQVRLGLGSAKVLHGFLEHPENFLWTILVGNTLANFIILGWLVAVLHDSLRSSLVAFMPLYAVIIFLFYAFYDLLPKLLFRIYPNRLCLWLARPFRSIHWLLRPLVALVETVSGLLLRWRGGHAFTGRLFGNREELRQVMQESSQALSTEERAMINRVLDLQTLTVRQVMRPLAQAVTVKAQTPIGEALALCRAKHFTRMPVWEEREGRRRISGVITFNTVLYQPGLDPAKPAAEFVQPAVFLAEDLRLEQALRQMQRSGQRLAIVLGPDRRETGIIALHDTLKVIFGEVSL